jgi:hypothetical protein
MVQPVALVVLMVVVAVVVAVDKTQDSVAQVE